MNEITINPKFKIGEEVFILNSTDNEYFSDVNVISKDVVVAYSISADDEGNVKTPFIVYELREKTSQRFLEQELISCQGFTSAEEYMVLRNQEILKELHAKIDVIEGETKKLKDKLEITVASSEIADDEEKQAEMEFDENKEETKDEGE